MRIPKSRINGVAGCLLAAGMLAGCLTPKPTVVPPAGIYNCPQTVTITDPRGGATIYYTTDGSAPTNRSTKYDGPFMVDSNTDVKAIAVATGSKPSADVSVQYSCTPNLSHAAFATAMQQRFSLPQPGKPVMFADVHQNDAIYPAAEALTPHLLRSVLCSGCVLSANFSPGRVLSRAQAAVTFVSVLVSSQKIQLPNVATTNRILANVKDARELPPLARPFMAAAIANGVLQLNSDGFLNGTKPFVHDDMLAAFATIQKNFNLPPASSR